MMDVDLNSEPQDVDDVSNTDGQIQKIEGEVEHHEGMELYVQGDNYHALGHGQVESSGKTTLKIINYVQLTYPHMC